MTSLKEKTAKGLLWGGIASGGQQLLNLSFGIILGRLLTRSDYGMVGMLSIFTLIASSLQEGGFISALNKKTHATDEDFNSVFWFNFTASISLYILLFFSAPYIATHLYNEPKLIPLARYVFIGFVISAVNIAPRAYLFRQLMVKETTLITLTALTLSGITGIIMAWQGFAYWGLATQPVVYALCMTIGSYSVTRWYPHLHFSLSPIREMFGFSSRLIVTNIFSIINNNIFTVLLGRFYGKQPAGDFTQANKWNSMGYTLVSNMLNSVAQPIFAKLSNKEEQLTNFRKLLRITALFSFIFLLGLATISDEFIVITIGTKWLHSAHILKILCVWGAFIPIQNLMTNLLIAKGHSDIFMWGTIGLALAEIGAALIMYPHGINTMLYIFVLINILWTFVWHFFVKREIKFTLIQFLSDVVPYLALSALLCVSAHFLLSSINSLWIKMLAKIIIISTTYISILWFARVEIFHECLNFLFKKH